MNPLVLLPLALGGLGLYLLRGPGRAAPPITSFQRALILGDSHSRQYGPGPGSWSLGGQLEQILTEAGLETKVVAHGGRGAPWFVSGRYPSLLPRKVGSGTLSRALADFRPDLLIVALGTNDALLGIVDGYSHSGRHKLAPFPDREREYLAVLAEFAQTARNAGVEHLVWLGPSKFDKDDVHLIPGGQQVAEWQQQVFGPLDFVSFYDSIPMTIPETTRDGIHFDRAGYRNWSRKAATAMGLPLRDGTA